MKTIEITYRYDADGVPPRPSDAHEARERLDRGSAAFAKLLGGLTERTGSARRIIDVDPRDLGLLPGENRPPKQHPSAAVLGVLLNAATAAFTLQQEFGSTGADGLRTTYGVYLLAARQIWAPRCGSAECNGLAHPPSDSSAFGELGDAVIRSDRFAMILDDGAQSVANDADKIE